MKDGEGVGEVITDSQVIDTNTSTKIRPNDPCSCGSGKKYKKCCGIK
ncbi:SEC-C domain-containing protein [Patescibacteria group bacterium]|nr:SEC-C domain-containing protein [Patescibacteria group bacterium]MBU1758987.1 SEC-C domain-containing protein [Patescibacteria group bacterium]